MDRSRTVALSPFSPIMVLILLPAATVLASTQEDKLKQDGGLANPFIFKDVGEAAGLFPHVGGIRGHGAAWGDVDGDGWIDLYVGTFHTDGAKPNFLFRNRKGKFELDDQKSVRISTRATGIVFADLDNDGDLDLYVGSMPAGKDT